MRPCPAISLVLAASALVGCAGPTAATDTDTTTDGPPDAPHTQVVATVVAEDYSTGSLVTATLDGWTLTEAITTTSGDPVVTADAGRIVQINRFGFDTVRLYTPGAFSAPTVEFSVAPADAATSVNPQDARTCDGALFVSLHNADALAVHDPATGARVGTVDLSAFADADGIGPEASTMAVVGGRLYVGLQRLDQLDQFTSAGGRVVEVDCAARAVVRDWTIGGNTNVAPWPDTGKVLVTADAFGDDVGGLYVLDPSTGDASLLVDADALGVQFIHTAVAGDRAVVIGPALDFSGYVAACVDLGTGGVTEAFRTPLYLAQLAANDRGEAWIAGGWSFLDPTASPGLHVVDVETCAHLTADGLVATSLAPTAVAFY